MINLAISLAAGLGGWLLTTLFFDSFWAGLLPFVLIFPALFIVLGRRINKKIEAIAADAQRLMAQVQNARTATQRDGIIERAVVVLEQGFAYRHYQFLVAGQFNAQIGQIFYVQKKFDKARGYLEKAYVRNGVSVAMLACVHFMKKQDKEMSKTFEKAVKYSRKESLLWNLYAWCLWKRGDGEGAMKVLNRAKEILKNDEKINSNLDALRNNKKMKMRGWKELWYQFHLEAPPQPKMQIDRRSVFRGR